jgi:hypothetical protein
MDQRNRCTGSVVISDTFQMSVPQSNGEIRHAVALGFLSTQSVKGQPIPCALMLSGHT